jgi:serine/threonine protein kinase
MNELLARIQADQHEQWRRGNRIRVEEYLARHPDLAGQEEVILDLIYAEVVLREELGERATAAEYLERFPQYAARLVRQFELYDGLDEDPLDQVETVRTAAAATSDSQPAPRPAAPDYPAIPGYHILEQFPAGGPGVVYKARERRLNRVVALKMIRHEADAANPEHRAMFRREAEAVARLNHPNVVQIYEFGEHRGQFYFTMEFVEGGTLERQLADRPLPPRRAAELAETLARALHAVHQKDIVHRDLKPGNVLLTESGVPKVADFGLAKCRNGQSTLTPSGVIVGTASYMAPEQARGNGRSVTPTADVYSLGAILYHLVAGRPPFLGATFASTLGQVLYGEPEPLRLGRASRDLEAICLKCLEKDPGDRYPSAEALAEDLRRFLDGKPTVARPRRWYQRAWRAARRRSRWAAAAMLCLMLPMALALTPKNPEPAPKHEVIDPRKLVEESLASGRPFHFAGHEPLPGPFRILDGTAGSFGPVHGQNCISLQTIDPSLLELVANPGQNTYGFSAEMLHMTDVNSGDIGLFFGLRYSPDGSKYAYYTLTFADHGHLAKLIKDNGEPVSRVLISAYARAKAGGGVNSRIDLDKPMHKFRPIWAKVQEKWRKVEPYLTFGTGVGGRALVALDHWRRLGVQIEPAGITVYWRDDQGVWKQVGQMRAEKLESAIQRMTTKFPAVAGLPWRFSPRDGLGLYSHLAEAYIRNVAVTEFLGK